MVRGAGRRGGPSDRPVAQSRRAGDAQGQLGQSTPLHVGQCLPALGDAKRGRFQVHLEPNPKPYTLNPKP